MPFWSPLGGAKIEGFSLDATNREYHASIGGGAKIEGFSPQTDGWHPMLAHRDSVLPVSLAFSPFIGYSFDEQGYTLRATYR
jgi:hypothetical protein